MSLEVWAAIDSPAVRHQLVEIIAASSLRELAREWGFESEEDARRYVHGPLAARIRKEAGEDGIDFLTVKCDERGI